jgi:hypothetical protein
MRAFMYCGLEEQQTGDGQYQPQESVDIGAPEVAQMSPFFFGRVFSLLRSGSLNGVGRQHSLRLERIGIVLPVGPRDG